MRALIGTLVKTQVADYPFAHREQAEAFVVSLKLRERERLASSTQPLRAGGGPNPSTPRSR